MYVNKRISFLLMHQFAWKNLLVFTALSTGVYLADHYWQLPLHLPFMAIGVIATAVAITLGFRNNSAYERFWEGRTIWGGVLNQSRIFTRQVKSFAFTLPFQNDSERFEEIVKKLFYHQIAFAHALRIHLRKEERANPDCWSQLKPFLKEEYETVKSASNKPNAILHLQSSLLHAGYKEGRSELFMLIQMENLLAEFTHLQGRCERIKNTPLPRQYAFFTKVFVWIFVVLLPFGLISELKLLTIPFSVLLSWIFVTLEQVGEYTENPFDNGINDVPMTTICHTIEIEFKEALNEKDIPSPLTPINGVLM